MFVKEFTEGSYKMLNLDIFFNETHDSIDIYEIFNVTNSTNLGC